MYTQLSIEDQQVYETVPQVLARVELHANDEWKACYKHALSVVCGTRQYFTADDVADVMKEMHPNVFTHEMRAAGAMLRNAAKDGLCRKTGQYKTCDRQNQHSCPKAEWESLFSSNQ